jgi:hypothetical protein
MPLIFVKLATLPPAAVGLGVAPGAAPNWAPCEITDALHPHLKAAISAAADALTR